MCGCVGRYAESVYVGARLSEERERERRAGSRGSTRFTIGAVPCNQRRAGAAPTFGDGARLQSRPIVGRDWQTNVGGEAEHGAAGVCGVAVATRHVSGTPTFSIAASSLPSPSARRGALVGLNEVELGEAAPVLSGVLESWMALGTAVAPRAPRIALDWRQLLLGPSREQSAHLECRRRPSLRRTEVSVRAVRVSTLIVASAALGCASAARSTFAHLGMSGLR